MSGVLFPHPRTQACPSSNVKETAITVACAVVSARLDYCNDLLVGMSEANLDKLQRVQNELARVVTGLHRRDHITPALIEPHWIPVRARITFKVATLVYKLRETRQPSYLSELISDYVPARHCDRRPRHSWSNRFFA